MRQLRNRKRPKNVGHNWIWTNIAHCKSHMMTYDVGFWHLISCEIRPIFQEWKKDSEDPGYDKLGCGNPICVVLDRRPMR